VCNFDQLFARETFLSFSQSGQVVVRERARTTPMSAGAVFDFERLARLEVGKVLPTVQSCQGPTGHPVKQREMKLFDMEMKNIEGARELGNPIEHQQ
jgi:hypothetical protein